MDDDASSKLFTIDHMLLVISSDHKRCWPRAMLAVVGHIDLCTVSMGKGSFCQYDIVRWHSGPYLFRHVINSPPWATLQPKALEHKPALRSLGPLMPLGSATALILKCQWHEDKHGTFHEQSFSGRNMLVDRI